jgi:hypothetical protein
LAPHHALLLLLLLNELPADLLCCAAAAAAAVAKTISQFEPVTMWTDPSVVEEAKQYLANAPNVTGALLDHRLVLLWSYKHVIHAMLTGSLNLKKPRHVADRRLVVATGTPDPLLASELLCSYMSGRLVTAMPATELMSPPLYT